MGLVVRTVLGREVSLAITWRRRPPRRSRTPSRPAWPTVLRLVQNGGQQRRDVPRARTSRSRAPCLSSDLEAGLRSSSSSRDCQAPLVGVIDPSSPEIDDSAFPSAPAACQESRPRALGEVQSRCPSRAPLGPPPIAEVKRIFTPAVCAPWGSAPRPECLNPALAMMAVANESRRRPARLKTQETLRSRALHRRDPGWRNPLWESAKFNFRV